MTDYLKLDGWKGVLLYTLLAVAREYSRKRQVYLRGSLAGMLESSITLIGGTCEKIPVCVHT